MQPGAGEQAAAAAWRHSKPQLVAHRTAGLDRRSTRSGRHVSPALRHRGDHADMGGRLSGSRAHLGQHQSDQVICMYWSQVEAELHAVSHKFARLHGKGPDLLLDLYGRSVGPPPSSSAPRLPTHQRRASSQRGGRVR